MTNSEHIEMLINQSKEDLGASEALATAGYYGHSLFYAHLVLEKLCKALWMRNRNEDDYPYIHNLLKLINGASVTLNNEQILFYSDMNQFQAKGRYTTTLDSIEKTVTEETCNLYLSQTKTEMIWLIRQLQ